VKGEIAQEGEGSAPIEVGAEEGGPGGVASIGAEVVPEQLGACASTQAR
jgi:hypothetical protein